MVRNDHQVWSTFVTLFLFLVPKPSAAPAPFYNWLKKRASLRRLRILPMSGAAAGRGAGRHSTAAAAPPAAHNDHDRYEGGGRCALTGSRATRPPASHRLHHGHPRLPTLLSRFGAACSSSTPAPGLHLDRAAAPASGGNRRMALSDERGEYAAVCRHRYRSVSGTMHVCSGLPLPPQLAGELPGLPFNLQPGDSNPAEAVCAAWHPPCNCSNAHMSRFVPRVGTSLAS